MEEGFEAPPSSRATLARAKEGAAPGLSDAVQFKAGHGVWLHPKLQQSIGVKVVEVSEQTIVPTVSAYLHVVQGADGLLRVSLSEGGAVANGWVTKEKAAFIQPGQEVELRADIKAGAAHGVVRSVDKSPHASFGDVEVVVKTAAPFDAGSRLTATFRAPAGEAIIAVPLAALLKTAEGSFVYTVNESFYLRTPVKVGATNAEFAETQKASTQATRSLRRR